MHTCTFLGAGSHVKLPRDHVARHEPSSGTEFANSFVIILRRLGFPLNTIAAN